VGESLQEAPVDMRTLVADVYASPPSAIATTSRFPERIASLATVD
jgi:hypothetical protein